MMLKIRSHFISIENFLMKYAYRLLQCQKLVLRQKRLHQQYHRHILIGFDIYKTSTIYDKNIRLIFLQNNLQSKQCYLSYIIANTNTTITSTFKCEFECFSLLIQSL